MAFKNFDFLNQTLTHIEENDNVEETIVVVSQDGAFESVTEIIFSFRLRLNLVLLRHPEIAFDHQAIPKELNFSSEELRVKEGEARIASHLLFLMNFSFAILESDAIMLT